MTIRTNEEIITQIKELIETQVKPAVANHGGNIEFVSYDEGDLLLELGGACSGCAGSMMTLKMGVENMLKHFRRSYRWKHCEIRRVNRIQSF